MPFYVPSIVESDLQQGEILSGIWEGTAQSPREHCPPSEFSLAEHDLVVVLSQSCDLAVRPGRSNDLRVLLAEIWLENLVAPSLEQLKRIRQNTELKYQYLRRFESHDDADGVGVDSNLIVDFRRVFSLPYDELDFQLRNGARRRCVLDSPYKEHLAARYAFFIARVALPEDHDIPKQKLLPTEIVT